MASLMEELINNLEEQVVFYEKLLKLSAEKTPVIISADLESLQRITDEEQEIVSKLVNLDKKREIHMKDIANVINKDVNSLKIADFIDMLESRPAERAKLASVYDRLSDTIAQMKRTNDQNKILIEDSLEMIQFDMNVLQAYKAAPETANYDKGAYSTGSVIGSNTGGFDAKQ